MMCSRAHTSQELFKCVRAKVIVNYHIYRSYYAGKSTPCFKVHVLCLLSRDLHNKKHVNDVKDY